MRLLWAGVVRGRRRRIEVNLGWLLGFVDTLGIWVRRTERAQGLGLGLEFCLGTVD